MKRGAIFAGVGLASFGLGSGITGAVFSQKSQSAPAVLPYSNVLPAQYIVYRASGTTYCLSSPDAPAQIASNSDSATVINDALENLTSGRTWKEKVIVKGNHTLSTNILMPSYSILEIQGLLTLANGTNTPCITNSDVVNGGQTEIEIYGGIVDGNKSNQTALAYNPPGGGGQPFYITTPVGNFDQGSGSCVYLFKTTNYSVHDIEFQNAVGDGIVASGGGEITLGGQTYNIRSHDHAGNGIRTTKSMRRAIDMNARVYNNGQCGYFFDSSYCEAIGIISDGNGYGFGAFSIQSSVGRALESISNMNDGFRASATSGSHEVVNLCKFDLSSQGDGRNGFNADDNCTFRSNELDLLIANGQTEIDATYDSLYLGTLSQWNSVNLNCILTSGNPGTRYAVNFGANATKNTVFLLNNGSPRTALAHVPPGRQNLIKIMGDRTLGDNDPAAVSFTTGAAYTNNDGQDEVIYYQDPNNATTTTVQITAASSGTTMSASILKGQLYTSPVLHPGDQITFTNSIGMATVSGKVFV